MRIAILHFSPANCDLDLFLIAKEAGFEAIVLTASEWCEQWQAFDAVFVMGGAEVTDVFQQALHAFDQLGKPILGVAEGAAVLVATGIVPGLEKYRVGVTLEAEHETWPEVTLVTDYQLNAYTRYFEGIRRFPVQEESTCFQIPSGLLFEMSEQGLALFYAGNMITGISNKRGNAMALTFFFKKGTHWQYLFQSLHAEMTSSSASVVTPLHYFPRTL